MVKIAFYTPKHVPEKEIFGGATLGFAGVPEYSADAVCEFQSQPRGLVLCGTYEEILTSIPDTEYKAAIVLCGNAGGENTFVKQLSEKLHCPMIGGGAAKDEDTGGLISGGGQANVLLIDDPHYDIQIEVKNIHENIIGTFHVDFDEKSPRIVKAIDGKEPRQWLNHYRKILGFSEDDFEHFTLSDTDGVNAHLSWDGRNLISGRDLEHEMIARYVKPEEVYPSVLKFYQDDENTLVFGCAGIKGITGELPQINSLGLYMFGEICMTEDKAIFGNLMLAKIKLIHKI